MDAARAVRRALSSLLHSQEPAVVVFEYAGGATTASLVDQHAQTADLISHEVKCRAMCPRAISGRMDFATEARDAAEVTAAYDLLSFLTHAFDVALPIDKLTVFAHLAGTMIQDDVHNFIITSPDPRQPRNLFCSRKFFHVPQKYRLIFPYKKTKASPFSQTVSVEQPPFEDLISKASFYVVPHGGVEIAGLWVGLRPAGPAFGRPADIRHIWVISLRMKRSAILIGLGTF